MSGEPLRPKDLTPVTFTLDCDKEKVSYVLARLSSVWECGRLDCSEGLTNRQSYMLFVHFCVSVCVCVICDVL